MFCFLLGWGSGLRAMEGEVLAEDELLRKLRDSRCRFQRRMQQLIEKVRPLPLAGWRGKEEGWEVEAGTVGQRDWSGWGTEGLGWGLGGVLRGSIDLQPRAGAFSARVRGSSPPSDIMGCPFFLFRSTTSPSRTAR